MWPAWRLYLERYATLRELEAEYSLDDVVEANEVLDAWYEAQEDAAERRKAEQKS